MSGICRTSRRDIVIGLPESTFRPTLPRPRTRNSLYPSQFSELSLPARRCTSDVRTSNGARGGTFTTPRVRLMRLTSLATVRVDYTRPAWVSTWPRVVIILFLSSMTRIPKSELNSSSSCSAAAGQEQNHGPCPFYST